MQLELSWGLPVISGNGFEDTRRGEHIGGAVLWLQVSKPCHVATHRMPGCLPFTCARSPTEASVLAETGARRSVCCQRAWVSDPSRRGVYPRSLKPQDVWPLSKENCWQQAEAVLFQLGMNKNMILPFFFAYQGKKKKKPTVMYFRRWISYLSSSLQQVPRRDFEEKYRRRGREMGLKVNVGWTAF